MIEIGNEVFETRIWDGAADANDLARIIEKYPAYGYVQPLQTALARGVMVATVAPMCGPFKIPNYRQAVVWLCDGLSDELGPAAFCHASIADFIKRCDGRAIILASRRSVNRVAVFGDVSEALARLESVLLIETTPEQHAAWHRLVWQISPRAGGSHVFAQGGE